MPYRRYGMSAILSHTSKDLWIMCYLLSYVVVIAYCNHAITPLLQLASQHLIARRLVWVTCTEPSQKTQTFGA
jgi:hypothetical protein